MRNPLWILNIGLVVLFFLVLALVGLTKQRLPARKALASTPIPTARKKDVSAVDLRLIYENDLFGTYTKPIVPPVHEQPLIQMPRPPNMQLTPHAELPRIQFLEPIKVVLKGIMYGTNEIDNRAILADQQTSQEKLYAVGDIVADAEIIRIESNRVLFLRSNGQQEVLFLTQKSAQSDPLYSKNSVAWHEVARQIGNNTIIVDPQALMGKVSSLAEFIDMLDITSVVNTTGVIEGMHIGAMPSNSLGVALGLHEGDVIKQVNGIDATTMQNRVMIYQTLKNLPLGATVAVHMVRGGRDEVLTMHIQTLPAEGIAVPEAQAVQREERRSATHEDIERSLESLAPAPSLVGKMHEQDRAAMKSFGGKDSLIQRKVPPL